MSSEHVRPLDPEMTALFMSKGIKRGAPVPPQAGGANGVKVRRVMQLMRDFSKKPFDQLKILDLGCGEGVYAIEAALRGAQVTALDGRTERMGCGAQAAERLRLANLRFEQRDVRTIDVRSHGTMDVVLALGVLYHLDEHDVFSFLESIAGMCGPLLIIDTHVALEAERTVTWRGNDYDGTLVREHRDLDSTEVRRGRLLASLDNPLSFWFTKSSLLRVLHDIGFSSVCECQVPLEPSKPEDRITLIAVKGERVRLSSYPWVNDKTEEEVEAWLNDCRQQP